MYATTKKELLVMVTFAKYFKHFFARERVCVAHRSQLFEMDA